MLKGRTYVVSALANASRKRAFPSGDRAAGRGTLAVEHLILSSGETVKVVEVAPPPAPPEPQTRPPRHRPTPSAFAVWIGMGAGAAIVFAAYRHAATHSTGQTQFALFWLGMLAIFVPAVSRLSMREVGRRERLAIVCALGVLTYLPKLLRTPDIPLFFDELAHWRQAEITHDLGRPFAPNPIVTVAQYFPGLHTLTAALRDLTGLPTFQLALLLIGLSHVLALVGVFVIAEHTTGSSRIGALAAAIYATNPSFLFFDTQYAYESLAMTLAIWVLAALVSMQSAAGRPRRQREWFALGIIVAGACVVTHHLTTYSMAATVALIAGVTVIRAGRGSDSWRNARLTGAFAAVIALAAIGWLVFVARATSGYLSPHLSDALSQLVAMIKGDVSARKLFARSTAPEYERLAGFLSPAIAAVWTALGLWRIRHRLPRVSASLALMLFGLLYFPSLAFILTDAGNEGARRSWGFTYIGLAVLIAPTIPWLLDRASTAQRFATTTAVSGLIFLMLLGNVPNGVNEEYRFPGPHIYGSDPRSITSEMLSASTWFRTTQGEAHGVIADRFTAAPLAAFGRQWTALPSEGFPFWNLYFDVDPPDALVQALRFSRFHYIVVDRRMSRSLPSIGIYFDPREPGAYAHASPVAPAALTKFDRQTWATKIYSSENVWIYRLRFEPPPAARSVTP